MMNIKCLGGPRDGEILQVFGEVAEPKDVLSLHDGNGGRASYRITDEFVPDLYNLYFYTQSPRLYVYEKTEVVARMPETIGEPR